MKLENILTECKSKTIFC